MSKKLLIQAASHAQKAANLILGHEPPQPELPVLLSGPAAMAQPQPMALAA